ncbi:hypothetical protein MNBD_CHLOROFLEXI01-4634 [hydrothermal vent metagenome]|uniref:Uncharacterized protein n=1 Tax=hydrothermal vent metagenome TaxID=652676 RepID=A0A3B0VQH6_9ZZZZ
MPSKTVTESGLDFILDADKLFLPEREVFYITKLSSHGVKICDVIFLNPHDDLLIIEIKSSSPREHQEFIKEIKQKFVDSLLIFVATWANRKNTQAKYFPSSLQISNVLQRKMRLVLIIASHKPEWLSPLRDSLRKECRPLEKLFSLEETQVYNQELARRKLKLTINE